MKKAILPAFLSCQGTRLTEDEKRLFSSANPLGICLFSRGCHNVENREQLKQLVTEIKNVINREDVLIAVDQEGGRVRRLSEPEFTATTSQQNLTTAELAKEHAYLISADLKECGINVNFAPVLDIEYPFTSAALQSRCFAGNAENVAMLAQATVDEYIKNGICPCVKHLPGHGRGVSDPHLELPILEEDVTQLANDFYPFSQLKNAPMGMVAHIMLKKVDSQNPSTTSKKVINEIIRQKIGFQGLLVSDAIMMHSLKGSIAQRAERVINAGCDVVCLGNAGYAENAELCATNLKLSPQAEEKMLQVAEIIKQSGDFRNYEYVKNKYCGTLKNIIAYKSEYDATEVLSRLRDKKGD